MSVIVLSILRTIIISHRLRRLMRMPTHVWYYLAMLRLVWTSCNFNGHQLKIESLQAISKNIRSTNIQTLW